MSDFSDAIDVLFADENIGEEALWKQGGIGSGVAVRIHRVSPESAVEFGASRALLTGTVIRVRKSDVEAPAKGDVFQLVIGGATYKIIADPKIDALGLVWHCEAPAAA